MTVVLGYVWGIWWWRCADSRIDVDPLRVPFSKLPTSQVKIAELRKAGLDKFRESCEMRGIPRTLPVDIVVCGDSPCPRTREVQVHRWNGFLPQWFLCGVGEDYFVCAPEFCFIMVAGNIRSIMREHVRKWQYVVALVELGCELCGMYSLQNTRRGFKDRTRPLTSSKNLYAFAGRVTHERGTSMVFAALPWVVDGMRSPMETVLYLMLCAPRKWGSLALPRPLCNVLLDVPEHLWDKTTLRHIRPDFLWPELCLIVEYNGEDSHEGRGPYDQEKQELAQDMGYKVITFRKQDLYDLGRFNAKARSVARYLGRRLPAASPDFTALQQTLQQMLLKHQRCV